MAIFYTYSIATDTATGAVCEKTLNAAIDESSIGGANFDGVLVNFPDELNAIFASSLTAPEITTLTSIINAHDGYICPPETARNNQGEGPPPPSSDGYSPGSIWTDNSTGDVFIFSGDDWQLTTPNLDGYAQNTQVTQIQNSLDGYIPTSDIGGANGVASLDAGGKIPSGQIPAVALPQVFVVLDDTARLALTVQEGDEAIQTSDGYHFIYDGYDWYERPGNAIADHVSDTDNPHDTSVGNLLPGTLAELNAIITDATLDDSGDARPPTAHAATHEDGGSDELTAQNLGSASALAGKLMQTDGLGGWTLIDTPVSAETAEPEYFDGYDTAGGTSIPGSWTDIPLDSERIKDTPFSHTIPSAEVTFNEAGIYTVWGRVTTEAVSGNSRTQLEMRAMFDPGGGYIEIPGTRGGMYAREVKEGTATAMAAFTLTVESGYKIKLQAMRVSGGGTIELLPNGSSLLIAKLTGIKGDKGDAGDGYIIIQDEGVDVANTPHGTINFTGTGVTATDAGNGVVDVSITGGGGSGSGKAFIPFGAAGITGDQYLKTAGGTTLGHLLTSDYRLKKLSILTDGYNDNTYIVEKNGATVTSTVFSNEIEEIVTGLNTLYTAGDKLNVRVTVESEDINNPYSDDGYTIFLSHVDGSTEASRNIINVASNFPGLGCRAENGATLGVTGKFNKAIEFDGSNDYAEILHQDEMDTTDCTIEFWFNADDVSGTQTLFSKDSSGYDTGGHQSIYLSGNDIRVRSQDTSTSNDDTISTTIVAGTWYHLALVLGAGGRKIFLDGVLIHTDGSWTDGMNGNREPIALGAGTSGSDDALVTPLTDYFNGKICELRISDTRRYESNFTPAASQFTSDSSTIGLWHFDETSGNVASGSSGTSCNLMAQATTSSFPEIETTIVKFGTDSVKLNNSQNDWLRQVHHDNYEQDEITVETWAYVYDSSDGILFQKGTSSDEGGLIVKFENTNPHMEVTYYGATTSRTIITSDNSFPKNAWNHIAVTLDSGYFKVYINGVLAGTEALTSDYQNIWNNNDADIYWGMQENNTNHLQVYLDEMRISSNTRNFDGGNIDVSVLVEMEEQ